MKNYKGATGASLQRFKLKKNQSRERALKRFRELKRQQKNKWTAARHEELVQISKKFNL